MYTKYGLTANEIQILVESKKTERRVWPILDKLTGLIQGGKPSGLIDGLEYRLTINPTIGEVIQIT